MRHAFFKKGLADGEGVKPGVAPGRLRSGLLPVFVGEVAADIGKSCQEGKATRGGVGRKEGGTGPYHPFSPPLVLGSGERHAPFCLV
jgi:hypothetical protein